jgi:hypothetical protein
VVPQPEVDQDRVQPLPLDLGGPRLDIGTRGGKCVFVAAHMVGQRATAAGFFRDNHVRPQAGQHADRGLVDAGGKGFLRAAGQQRHAGTALALRAMDLRPLRKAGGRQGRRRQFQHGAQALRKQGITRNDGDQRAGQASGDHGQAKPRRVRQNFGQGPAQYAFVERSLVRLLDIAARVIHQVHVVHAGRARGHAGQAGKATVHVAHHVFGGRLSALQHVLHQVDAAAGRIQFVAQQKEGGARRRAHAAMHAGAQNLIAAGRVGVF